VSATATPPPSRTRPWPIVADGQYDGSRIPARVPTVLEIPADLRESPDVLQVNFGPNHPSTHGVLRLIVDLHGEEVVGVSAVIGYLHTGFEKSMESKTYWKCVTFPERIDYVGYQNNELVFVLAVEELLGLEVPTKAKWMRMLLCELNRIHSHLVFLGTSALELGAISMFWYCFRERETILDLFELVTGQRMHTRYFQVGGLAEDIPPGFFPECRAFIEWMPRALDDYRDILHRNEIWLERTQGIGVLSAQDAIALGQTGPNLRASGVDWDLRRDQPYLHYEQVDFRVPVYPNGDVYDRYRVRMDEMAESTRIVRQCVDKLERGRPQGRAAATRGAPHLDGVPHPSLQDRHRGLPRAGGRDLRRGGVAARRVGLLSRLRRRPEALARPLPGAVVRGARGDRILPPPRAHRRPDRGRRLARRGDGRHRQVSSFHDEVQELKARYPEGTRSAVLPALRLAQERHGWLSREALEETAEALDVTPAYCYSVASFYDMFHLEPVGRHTIEVCTNVCCGLVNAQAVLDAFEQELGIGPGETTPDGEVTLRAVECLGGCSTPTIVAVDHAYRQSVKPENVPAIVAELGE
jgi:NADH-quinone oxidoreductase subunit D